MVINSAIGNVNKYTQPIIKYITCDDHNVNYESILYEIDSIHISHMFGVASRPCLFKRGC